MTKSSSLNTENILIILVFFLYSGENLMSAELSQYRAKERSLEYSAC
jgi:hypothetical protein